MNVLTPKHGNTAGSLQRTFIAGTAAIGLIRSNFGHECFTAHIGAKMTVSHYWSGKSILGSTTIY
jgi:hypothetical protein